MKQYTRICDNFFALLYQLVLHKPTTGLSKEAIEIVSLLGDWYINEDNAYIKIYVATKPPHMLPRYVPNIPVLKEVAYQTIMHGFNDSLIKDQKKLCPTYLLYIGLYKLNNSTFARMEAKAIQHYKFVEEIFKRHDLQKVVFYHAVMWPYT